MEQASLIDFAKWRIRYLYSGGESGVFYSTAVEAESEARRLLATGNVTELSIDWPFYPHLGPVIDLDGFVPVSELPPGPIVLTPNDEEPEGP